jgi:hypothetical protein
LLPSRERGTFIAGSSAVLAVHTRRSPAAPDSFGRHGSGRERGDCQPQAGETSGDSA